MTTTELDLLLGWLDEAYAGPAWHGPSLRVAIRGVDAGTAGWRPGGRMPACDRVRAG